jgi:hypothetical protein
MSTITPWHLTLVADDLRAVHEAYSPVASLLLGR